MRTSKLLLKALRSLQRPGHHRARGLAPVRIAGLCLALLSGPALTQPQPSQLRVEADRLSQAGLSASGLSLHLRSPEQPGAGFGLEMRARELSYASLGYRFTDLQWRCELRPRDVGVWRCAGPLRSQAGAAGELVLDLDRGAAELSLQRGRMRLQAAMPAGEGAIAVQAERLPAAWLQPLLQSLWSEARLTEGFLQADLELDLALDAPRIEGRVRAEGLGLDTSAGTIAAAGLDLQGRLGLELGEQIRLGLDLAFSGGEALAGPVYVALPAQPVKLVLSALGQGTAWQLEQLDWNDPEGLVLNARGGLDLDAEPVLRELRLQADSRDAHVLVSRYLEAVLGTLGLPSLRASGGLQLQGEWREGQLHSLALQPELLSLRDGQGRFGVTGLSGGLGFSAAAQPRSDRLGFESAQIYGLTLGQTSLDWASAEGEWRLQRPAQFPVLGGVLRLDTLRWNRAAAEGDDRFAASAALLGLDMAELSRVLGWPSFSGELSGEIPGMRYSQGVLGLEGALRMRVFDGEVEVGGLSVERPFGVAPTLAADVELRSLDLQPLTAAFGFGEISGRMNGYIRGLRLLDWAPVAFDARFQTDEASKDPRRISQRAVRDLSSVGGMGAAAALQQSVLRAFETFAYARIGISCRLRNHVCTMDGVSRTARGYALVEGSGIPRISVNGMQREVDWPVLVDRLRAVTQGQVPTID